MNTAHAYWVRLCELYRKQSVAFLLLSGSLIYAAVHILFFTTARDNAVPLWLLACLLVARSLMHMHDTVNRAGNQFAAWVLLLLAPLCVILVGDAYKINTTLAVLCLVMAILSYAAGIKNALNSLAVLVLTLLIIPVQEQLFLALSYPLRYISTILTVESLSFFGSEITYERTTIQIGESKIAITDACSGITQLAVLFLVGYVLVIYKQHVNRGYALLHYLSLVPIVILANGVRLILTVLLYYQIGENAFNDTYHAGLGYFFLILATGIFYSLGSLFPDRQSNTTPA
jgi:exosortase